MRKIAIGLLAGAGALLTGSANASDIYTSSEYTNSDLIQQVRMVCDEDGRCYRTRGSSRWSSAIHRLCAARAYIEHDATAWDEGREPASASMHRCELASVSTTTLVNNPEKAGERLGSARLSRRARQYSFA